jgi:hypothetical protein
MSSLQSPIEANLRNLIDQAKLGLGGDAYKASVLDAYLFGYSFAWLYAKEQLQVNGAAGMHGKNVPVNAFYTNTLPDAISTGGVAPDANVLYANAFLQVSPGQPVVVQLPDVQTELQFFSVQSANSATQNYQVPYPSTSIYTQSSIQSVANPDAGQVLFYWGTDDPDQYQGEFTQRVAVNTPISFLTGRVLVDPALLGGANAIHPATYAVATIASLSQQFVAASYDTFAQNGYSMSTLENAYTTALTPEIERNYFDYSGPLKGEFFWETLALALNQSPPPSFGIGSEPGPQGSALEYSKRLSDFGVVYTEGQGYQFDLNAVSDQIAWLEVTDVAYELVTSIDTLAADNASGSWQNVPASLGDYGNSLVGYLMRDVAHVANSPASAVYPLTYNDSDGQTLLGGSTYVMVIRNALAGGLPPLAPSNVSAMSNLLVPSESGALTVMNQGGFWSFTAYDQNLNVTPAINQTVTVAGVPVQANYTAAVNPALPADTFFNPNTASAPYTLSSLQVGASFNQVSGLPSQPVLDSIPNSAQFRFEENGDLLLIMSPYRPLDSRYWNNWLPTPLMNFNSDFATVLDANTWQPFTEVSTQGVPYSLMLRVYNPNVVQNDSAQAVMYQAPMSGDSGFMPGQIWNFPSILAMPQLADAPDWVEHFRSVREDQVVVLTPESDSLYGGFGLNTAVVAGPRSSFVISNDGVSLTIRGLSEEGLIDASLTNYQQIQFSDVTVVFDLTGAPNLAIYSLYQTAFDRMADLEGFQYWSQALSGGQASLADIALDFTLSAEYESSPMEEMTNTEFLDAIYENAFDRSPDTSGFDFWLSALDNGASRSEVMLGFAVSQESWNLVLSDQPVGLSLI